MEDIQSLKIEISKHAQLHSYERIAFHKILGILKTENGMQVLLKELDKDPIIRESAILTLKDFNYKDVHDGFLGLLQQEISDIEKTYILEHFENYGSTEHISGIVDFIENYKKDSESLSLISKAFNAIQNIVLQSFALLSLVSAEPLIIELTNPEPIFAPRRAAFFGCLLKLRGVY